MSTSGAKGADIYQKRKIQDNNGNGIVIDIHVIKCYMPAHRCTITANGSFVQMVSVAVNAGKMRQSSSCTTGTKFVSKQANSLIH